MKIRKLIKILVNVFVVTGLLVGVFSGSLKPSLASASDTQSTSLPTKHTLPESETGLYIVRLLDPSVAAYMGGINGLKATSPQATGTRRLDPTTPASQAYEQYLNAKQAELVDSMQTAFGHTIEVQFDYQYALNAVAVRISHAEALQAFDLPGVKMVYADKLYQLDTDMGPTLIGAPSIWDGDTIGGVATQGDGIVIGMIDSGVNHRHPSFAEVGPVDGIPIINPYGAGVFHGYCSSNPGFCNNKLIGAYGLYQGPSPEDLDGHGSHTSSTAGGNRVVAEFTVGTEEITRTISGVAPHANIVAYKVCGTDGCPGTASELAVEHAIEDDQVDVINYSISGSDSPWTDPVDLAFLNAFSAGIFVSASAGNAGPVPSTVAHTGPWNSSVAASTHSRIVANTLDVTATGGDLNGLAAIPGDGVVIASDIIDNIRWAGDVDPDNIDACVAFPAGSFNGVVGLAQRGNCNFSVKVDNLHNAGAVGAVIYNNVGGPPITMGEVPLDIPSVMVTLDDGVDIADLITGDATAMVTIHSEVGVVINPAWQDIMAGFSSQGPSQFELLKPDYTAPGVNILAAFAATGDDPLQYAFLQGTSMSSPHSAGSAALMMALRPSWTVAEIRSAMDSTADPTPVKDINGIDPANPFEMGSGRLALNAAGSAGLVMNETTANYTDADPNAGGDPKTLNQPSMVDYECDGSCSWTRTVKSVLPASATWTINISADPNLALTVEPNGFTLDPGETQLLTITADSSAANAGDVLFGAVTLLPGNGSATRLPVVVVVPSAAIIAVDPTEIVSEQTAQPETKVLTISNLGDEDLTWSLYDGTPTVTWSDNFDSYPTGSQMHGQGGWKGWGNVPGAGALTSNAQARSAPNSVDILGASDLVHEYVGATSGVWTYTAWQYIPTTFTGQSYFILLNRYTDAGSTNNWSTQVAFNASTGLVVNEGTAGGMLPMITGQWVELRVEINLDSDIQTFYYGDQMLFRGSWTGGMSGGGIKNIAAVDLFANGASSVFYDDISLTHVVDTPWLSTNPSSGTTLPGGNTPVDVVLDATGFDPGVYTTTLFASSNDLVNPLIEIPVTMSVFLPEISVSGPPLETTLYTDETTTITFTIGNSGTVPLNWSINENNLPGLKKITTTPSTATQTRKAVTLGLESAPVNLPTLTGNAIAGPLSFALDDGGAESIIGLTGADWEFLYLNRFTPSPADFPLQLDTVTVAFYNAGGVQVGDRIRLVLYENNSGDVDPGPGAIFMGSYDVTVMGLGAWNNYTLPEPVTFNGPGDILVGVIVLEKPGTSYSPAALDRTTPQHRSWLGIWTVSPPPTVPTLPPDDTWMLVDDFLPGNWLVRASGQTGGVDVPWLSEVPTYGTLPVSESVQVGVTFDSTGLSPAEFLASLDIHSSAAHVPVVTLPVTLTVLPQADLSITKVATPEPAYTENPITYTLTITNDGPQDATGVIVVDSLPAGVTDISAPGCTVVDLEVTCAVGALAAGETTQLMIVVTAPEAGGNITNSALVSANEHDPNEDNNLATVVTTVKPSAYYIYLPIIFK